MGVSSVIQQTFNFIDVKIYYKKQLDYKQKYYSKGWHISIYTYKYSFYMWRCKQQARNADEWRNRSDLTVDDDSLSLLARCCRVPLVHEIL